MRRSTSTGHTFMFAAALSALAAGCGQADLGESDRGRGAAPLANQATGSLITSVGLDGLDGQPLEAYMSNHPAYLDLKISTSEMAATHHLQVGLVEESDGKTPKDGLRTCMIGDWHVTYGAAKVDAGSSFTLHERVVIPDDCISAGNGSGVFNLWVGIDPLMEDEVGDAPADPAQAAAKAADPTMPSAPVKHGYGTQFFNAAAIDLDGKDRNASCVGPHGEEQCVAHIHVVESGGHNLQASALTTASSIGSLDAACSIGGTLPLFLAHTELRLDGSRAQDGNTEGTEAVNTLAQLSADPVKLHYSICPRQADGGEAGACAPQTTWAPLSIGGDGGLIDAAAISQIVAGEPNEHDHPLCAAPDGAACARINGTGADAESWVAFNTFNLKVCADVPFDETRNGGGDASADNCVVVPVHVARTATASDPVAQAGESSQASSVQFRRTYTNSWGGSVVGINLDAGTDSIADLSGATTHNWAKSDLSGWFSKHLVNIWADAAAYVSVTGSNVDAGVEILGTRYWSYQHTLNSIHLTWAQSYTKSWSVTYNYGILGLGLNVTGSVNAAAGITTSLDVTSQNGNGPAPFAAATRIGWAHAAATPYASLSLGLSAYADIFVLKGGVTANLNLLVLSLPAVGDLRWGLVDQPVNPALLVTANASLDVVLNTLSGSIRVWVDARRPAWCSCGHRCPGYPCTTWASIYNQNIASWNGWTWTSNIFTTSGQWLLY